MNILNVLPTDVKKRLNPTNAPGRFLGQDSTVNVADVQDSCDEWAETVLSRIPAMYLGFSERSDKGEILVQSASGGETSVKLGLTPVVPGTVRIYVNLPVPWYSRQASLALSGCTVDETTGIVTLPAPLRLDDTVVGEYHHTAMSECSLLRRITVDLAATEWARRLYPDDRQFDRYLEWEKSAWFDLARMKSKDGERMGIRMFDRLQLLDETKEERLVGGGDLYGSGEML